MDECRRSGQIPAFGNWDYANELPITQYFESARQAGLIRYCSSTGECDVPNRSGDLYDAVEFNKPHLRTAVVVSSRKKRESKNSRRNYYETAQVKEESKVVKFKVEDVDVQKYTQQQQKQKHNNNNEYFEKEMITKNNNYHSSRQPTATTSFKPVDEDLYKIPPHLLHTSKRKKMLGFLSRCLAPSCIV